MVFNGDADGQDLVTLSNKLAGNATNTSFPLSEKALYANMRQREILASIRRAYGGWIYDDSNNSGNPEATANLVSGTQEYAFINAEQITAVEYQDSSGFWSSVKPITIEEILSMGYAESEFQKVSGYPLWYRPYKNRIKLYPAPNFNGTAALKVHESRDVTAFASTSTTMTPGFDSSLHEGLAIGMALSYAKRAGLPAAGGVMRNGVRTGLLSDWGEFLDRVNNHYSMKFKQEFPQKMKKPRDFVAQYM